MPMYLDTQYNAGWGGSCDRDLGELSRSNPGPEDMCYGEVVERREGIGALGMEGDMGRALFVHVSYLDQVLLWICSFNAACLIALGTWVTVCLLMRELDIGDPLVHRHRDS